MKMTKRVLGILLACLMLAGMLSVGVYAAEGSQDDPINANDKWFGYGTDCYLLNPTIAAGSDGVWYTFSPEQNGILVLEHQYKNVDYDITVDWYGVLYTGGSVDGVSWNRTIMTLPVSVGDPITVHIATKDKAAGTVYANMKIVAGTIDDPVKVKSKDNVVYVGAGETVYFQDDTLNADYATKGLLVDGSVDETVFYAVSVNSTSGAATKKAFTDSDNDATIEATLGGSLGSAGAPPVKPMWAIENNTTVALGTLYFLTIVDAAHECVYDDNTDLICNTCGEEREPPICTHRYDGDYDATCNLCGEVRYVAFEVVSFIGNSASEDVTGLAFRFQVDAANVAVTNSNVAVYDNATVTPTSTSDALKLVKMGAVVSNDPAAVLDIENATIGTTKNIEAKYLCDLETDAAQFAVRIIHIPLLLGKGDTPIFARPYYIYEADGAQMVVYGETQSATYNAVLNTDN